MNAHERTSFYRFLSECLLVAGSVILASLLLFIASENPDAYGSAINAKIDLLESTSSPKLVFVGGSGLAFGIDSPKLKQELGLTPVNLGLYAGMGMDPLLSLVSANAKSGDVVVLIPEYQLLENDPYGEGFMILELIQADPRFILTLSPRSLGRALLASPNWLKTRAESLVGRTLLAHWRHADDTLYHRVYRSENFNAYGDMVGHLKEDHRFSLDEIQAASTGFVHGKINEVTKDHLLLFIADMEQRGVRVYSVPQALPEAAYLANEVPISAIESELERVLPTGTILSDQRDFLFPNDAFFDTVNHLAAPGREERTVRLAHVLETAILKP